jgi:hypothetical protein
MFNRSVVKNMRKHIFTRVVSVLYRFMVACHSLSGIITIVLWNFFCSSAAPLSTPAFVPIAVHRSPLNIVQMGKQSTGMLPGEWRLPLELRRPRPSFQFRYYIATANTTHAREDPDSVCCPSRNDHANRLDPVATVLLFNGAAFILLGVSLYGLMQVCMHPALFGRICFDFGLFSQQDQAVLVQTLKEMSILFPP